MRNEATALQQMKARVQEAGWVTCVERIDKDERHMLLCSFQCLRGGAVEGIRPRVGPGSCFALGTLDFEQGGGEQRNAHGTSPGTVSLLGGCKDRWTKRGGELGLFQISKTK